MRLVYKPRDYSGRVLKRKKALIKFRLFKSLSKGHVVNIENQQEVCLQIDDYAKDGGPEEV